MLYHLLYPLADQFGVFNLFRYITFRTAYAAVTALVASLILGPIIIRYLQKKQWKEEIREEGPEGHKKKAGTPTMGGLLILAAIVGPTLLWADLSNRFVQAMLLVTIWMGVLGFIDDYLKVVRKRPKGMVARTKMAGQVLLGLILGAWLYFYPPALQFGTSSEIPFFKHWVFDFGALYIVLVVIVIAGTSNAVNLTDGLDGLAIGLSGICFLALGAIAYITGRIDFSRYLSIEYLAGAGELTVFCGAAVGASLGFLWFNSHPASVFMGDTGSLALGGAIGACSLLLKKELLLLILGGVFVAEALSVIIQVVSYRLRNGKRVFKMAPLHHHFELSGWAESKVVTRFWIMGMICAVLSLSTLKIR
jgi:phospho-N-acetylmuramoyl-pentapeptide-transferase